MFSSFGQLLLPCFVLTLIQFVAALPWLWAMDSRRFREQATKVSGWGTFLGSVAGVTVLATFFLAYQKGATGLEFYGRGYGSLLHLQLLVDLLIGGFLLMLLVWPKGGAVADRKSVV